MCVSKVTTRDEKIREIMSQVHCRVIVSSITNEDIARARDNLGNTEEESHIKHAILKFLKLELKMDEGDLNNWVNSK